MAFNARAGSISVFTQRARKNILAGPKTLRSQLIVGIWLALAGIFIPLNIIHTIDEERAAVKLTKETLVNQGSFVYFGVKKWRDSINYLLEFLSYSPAIRKLNTTESKEIFDRTKVLFPQRFLHLWTKEGRHVVGTRSVDNISLQKITPRLYLIGSNGGEKDSKIYKECEEKKPCFVESIPVFGPGKDAVATRNQVGVLSMTIKLEDTREDSGMSGIYERVIGLVDNKASRKDFNSPWKNPISFQNGDYTGMEVMMVNKKGDVIFPISVINDEISLETHKKIQQGPWGVFVRLGQKAKPKAEFQLTKLDGKDYFAYSREIDSKWNLVAISDKESALHGVYQNLTKAVLHQILVLICATIAIILVSRNYARPIQKAEKVIREFSKGNFEARIDVDRADEIGELFENINETGGKLRELLNSQLAHAITDQQLKTAREIQKGFVVEKLSNSKSIELAGDFAPAYEIGADWYDSLSLGDITYVVIADVCDKGIASALFMSVFRSLTRYSILDENSELEEQGLAKSLEDAITQVNDYMATNHGMSSMFATLFLGAYVSSEHKLSYVCAGHEIPIIVRSKGVLENLEPTGPAIGIFAGANYEVNTVDLLPGQILFTYTDGLVDARSPSNASWGMEGVKKVLGAINPEATSAQELLDTMTEKVNAHRGDADQFDDLTMLVMKINPD